MPLPTRITDTIRRDQARGNRPEWAKGMDRQLTLVGIPNGSSRRKPRLFGLWGGSRSRRRRRIIWCLLLEFKPSIWISQWTTWTGARIGSRVRGTTIPIWMASTHKLAAGARSSPRPSSYYHRLWLPTSPFRMKAGLIVRCSRTSPLSTEQEVPILTTQRATNWIKLSSHLSRRSSRETWFRRSGHWNRN